MDRVYMAALQAMTGRGGWPMSIFLTPELEPFFGASYIPPQPRYGQPGFGGVTRGIHRAWVEERPQIEAQAEALTTNLRQTSLPALNPTTAGEEALRTALGWYRTHYDEAYGGFGVAPKFPRPVSLDFLLDEAGRTGDAEARRMALATLRAMARGGVYDHLGGGFHRYATDARWRVPHFEKMLYDQAQLVDTYLRAFRLSGDSLYAAVARDVIAYVDRVMLHEDGGFYSAEDAESATDPAAPDEKEEGAFYTWTKAEIDRLLPPDAARAFAYAYGVEPDGNAAGADPHGEFVGENILYRAHTAEEVAAHIGRPVAEIDADLAEARRTLFLARQERPRAHLDDKIILSWNGMMIGAYANAYAALGDPNYREVAERSADFLLEKLYDPETGDLLRRYRGGEARYAAHLEDYAAFVHGLLDLHDATGERRWLEHARTFTDAMIDRFFDEQNGGFFATAGDDPTIIVRSKEYYDGAEPSGNSLALLDLVRLAVITGEPCYRRLADASLKYFGAILQRGPAAPAMLRALAHTLDG